MRPLPRPLQALVTWVAILPLVLLVSMLTDPMTVGWPGPLRSAVVITVVVPLAVFWAVPTLARLTQRLRGVPSTVLAASCPAPGVRGITSGPASGACTAEAHDRGPAAGRVADEEGRR